MAECFKTVLAGLKKASNCPSPKIEWYFRGKGLQIVWWWFPSWEGLASPNVPFSLRYHYTAHRVSVPDAAAMADYCNEHRLKWIESPHGYGGMQFKVHLPSSRFLLPHTITPFQQQIRTMAESFLGPPDVETHQRKQGYVVYRWDDVCPDMRCGHFDEKLRANAGIQGDMETRARGLGPFLDVLDEQPGDCVRVKWLYAVPRTQSRIDSIIEQEFGSWAVLTPAQRALRRRREDELLIDRWVDAELDDDEQPVLAPIRAKTMALTLRVYQGG